MQRECGTRNRGPAPLVRGCACVTLQSNMPNCFCAEERAGAAAEIFARQRVIGVVGEAGVVDPRHPRVAAQKFGGAARVFDVTLDAQGDGLDPLQQQESGERREHRAGRALIDAAAARDVGGIVCSV